MGFMYMYVCTKFNISYGIKYMITYTLLCEGLDNVFAFPNLQTISFKFSQVVFTPLHDVFSKQIFVTTTLQSYTAHIWP
jgi:hypothetical protein